MAFRPSRNPAIASTHLHSGESKEPYHKVRSVPFPTPRTHVRALIFLACRELLSPAQRPSKAKNPDKSALFLFLAKKTKIWPANSTRLAMKKITLQRLLYGLPLLFALSSPIVGSEAKEAEEAVKQLQTLARKLPVSVDAMGPLVAKYSTLSTTEKASIDKSLKDMVTTIGDLNNCYSDNKEGFERLKEEKQKALAAARNTLAETLKTLGDNMTSDNPYLIAFATAIQELMDAAIERGDFDGYGDAGRLEERVALQNLLLGVKEKLTNRLATVVTVDEEEAEAIRTLNEKLTMQLDCFSCEEEEGLLFIMGLLVTTIVILSIVCIFQRTQKAPAARSRRAAHRAQSRKMGVGSANVRVRSQRRRYLPAAKRIKLITDY